TVTVKEKVEDRLFKQDQSLQTVHMLCRPKPNYNELNKVVQIVLLYLDSGCSKYMTEDRSRLMNFVKKFIGTVRFGNDHFGAIMGYEDYMIGDSVISRVYYVEGRGHNLFSVEQFCDADLEVAFRKHSCYVQDTDGVELIKGSRGDWLQEPLCLTRAKQIQPALYNGHEIIKDNHTQLTPKQIFWSNDLMKLKSEALKEQTKVSRPLKAFTVYPPNTPAALVPKVLPTKSQVKIYIFTLIQLFLKFDQTCKKRITPTAITDGERGFEQAKACYLQEVIPFFKTLKDNFEGIQKALTKEVKEMKDVFEELEAEVAQYAVDGKHDATELKNLLIANDLIAECLS
nr:copia protein [Tanacetum cinerariifolium]